jgi:hypothetical protein
VLTTHHLTVPSLRMSSAIPLLPSMPMVDCCRFTFTLHMCINFFNMMDYYSCNSTYKLFFLNVKKLNSLCTAQFIAGKQFILRDYKKHVMLDEELRSHYLNIAISLHTIVCIQSSLIKQELLYPLLFMCWNFRITINVYIILK